MFTSLHLTSLLGAGFNLASARCSRSIEPGVIELGGIYQYAGRCAQSPGQCNLIRRFACGKDDGIVFVFSRYKQA